MPFLRITNTYFTQLNMSYDIFVNEQVQTNTNHIIYVREFKFDTTLEKPAQTHSYLTRQSVKELRTNQK